MIAATVYAICAAFYVLFGQGIRQPWDNPAKDVVYYHPKTQDASQEMKVMLKEENSQK